MWWIRVCILWGLALVTWAEEPPFAVLRAAWEPGGFVAGQVMPGSHVFYNSERVPVTDGGVFLVGFDREPPTRNVLKVCEGNECREWHAVLAPRVYARQAIRGVDPRTVHLSPKDEARVEREAAAIRRARQDVGEGDAFAEPWVWPVRGPISGVYGSMRTYNGEERNWHKGFDVAMPTGTPVKAVLDGKVVFARSTFMNGNLIVLAHGGRLFSGYAHLSRMKVKEGDSVAQGQLIGAIGTTGRSTGPHLHLGAYWGDMALDPALFLGYHPADSAQKREKGRAR